MEQDVRDLDEVIFGILSEKDIRDISVCQIDNPKLGDKNGGYGTVYDPRMGPIENNKNCETCNMDIWKCSGHYGFIEMNEPIIHPLFYKRVVDFLRCVCIKCNNLLITEDQINLNGLIKIKSTKRFDKILEKIEKIDMCPVCSHPQPDIKYTSTDNNISMVYKQKDKGKISIVIPVDDIKKTFENLTDENVKLLGFNPELVHPKSLIMSVFPVIPYCCRPFVLADGQTCDDDLTIQIVEIIKANNHLKFEEGEAPLNDVKRQKYIQTLKFRISTFYNNSQNRAKHTTNGRPIKGLKERITGKEGLIRNNIMGKRCWIKGTKILLWNGNIKNVEDIKIGDILIGDDGEKREVLNLCSGEDNMYKIYQNNGDDYIVNSEHILSLKFTNTQNIKWNDKEGWCINWFDKDLLRLETKKIKPSKFKTKEEALKEMELFKDTLNKDDTIDIPIRNYLKLSDKNKKLLFGYKLNKAVKWSSKIVEIDPYILGMWLGDGSSRGDSFTSNDIELVDYWKKWASSNNLTIQKHDNIHYGITYKGKGIKNIFLETLKKYDLINNKHIPDDFIYNDEKTRLSLLAGLIDTDGSVEQDGVTIRITQSYEHSKIIDKASFIASSLGFQTSLYQKKTTWFHKNIKKNGIALILTISGHGIENIPTILPRKKCRPPKNRILTISNIKVEPYGIDKFYGFEINNNRRFLLKDFTVGHNCEFTGRTVIGPEPTLKMGQLGIPKEIAENLTLPVQVTNFNYEYLTNLVNNGKVNIVKTKGGEKINIHHHIFNRGTRLNHGDIIIRKDEDTGKEIEMVINNGKEMLKPGDKLKRNDEFIKNIKYPEKRKYHLNIGDICERQLQNGDIVLLNRQPTLHVGSMMAQEIVIHDGKTFRFNLSIAKSFNADYDGDEMNIHIPQSLEAQAEMRLISASKNFIISAQSSKPNMCIVQDSLLGAYRMTKGIQLLRKDQFYDISMKTGLSLKDVQNKIQTIRKVFKEKGKKAQCFHGKGLISLAFPNDLNYEKKNNTNPDEPIVKIYKGVLYEGTLDKSTLGAVSNSLIQIIHKEYGPDITATFIDSVQFITNNWLLIDGFSIGIGDCLVQDPKKSEEISDVIKKCLIEAETIKNTTSHPGIREVRITAALSKAKDIGLKIAKDALDQNNNFLSTVKSGSKGDYFNVAQITGLLGQQNLLGQRVNPVLNNGKRTLPHYPFENLSIEMEYESRGFIDSSFIVGLNPKQFYMHAMSGREGCCDKLCHKQVVASRFFVIPTWINGVRQNLLILY
jgi:DNA-directed RNA polymerase beta' subunit